MSRRKDRILVKVRKKRCRVGRKPILFISLAGFIVTNLLLAFVNVPLLFIPKKETGRCSGGNTTGGPRLGVCGGSPGYCTPSTANNLDGSMELDTFQSMRH